MCLLLQLLYKRSVVKYKKGQYSVSRNLKDKLPDQTDATEVQYICKSCHGSLKKNKTPPQATWNGLQLSPIPNVMKDLSLLECHLISKIQPFMKIVSKPRGAQHGIKGSVVLVPADLSKITTALPRTFSSSGWITLALTFCS